MIMFSKFADHLVFTFFFCPFSSEIKLLWIYWRNMVSKSRGNSPTNMVDIANVCMPCILIEYWSVMSSNFLSCISAFFMTIFQQNLIKNPHAPNLTWIGSWWLEPGQFTLISVGLLRYSCSHISGPHELIPTKFGLWMFFIMLHRYMVSKTLKCKKKFLWCHRFCTL